MRSIIVVTLLWYGMMIKNDLQRLLVINKNMEKVTLFYKR